MGIPSGMQTSSVWKRIAVVSFIYIILPSKHLFPRRTSTQILDRAGATGLEIFHHLLSSVCVTFIRKLDKSAVSITHTLYNTHTHIICMINKDVL